MDDECAGEAEEEADVGRTEGCEERCVNPRAEDSRSNDSVAEAGGLDQSRLIQQSND